MRIHEPTREAVAKAVAALGYDLRLADTLPGWDPDVLRAYGSPATVIDVGAGHGTPSLYGAFPDAHHVLLEPLEEFEENLAQRLGSRRGEYHRTAVGEQVGTIEFNFNRRHPLTSSVLSAERWPLGAPQLESRTVPITTLDKLLEEQGWTAPFGLKIDTEGYEDRVIRGASRLLERTEFVVSEVWLSPRFEGSYTLEQFLALMDSHGFRLRDILMTLESDPAGEMMLMDAVFLRA